MPPGLASSPIRSSNREDSIDRLTYYHFRAKRNCVSHVIDPLNTNK